MKKKALLILMFMLIPTVVLAAPAASVTTSSSSIENGKSVTINVTLTDTAAWNIKIEGSGAASCSQKQADVTSTGKSTTKKFSLACKATKEGTINVSVTGDITSGTGDTKDISISKQVTVTKAKSSVNTLSELKVDGESVPSFSSATTSYNVGEKSGSSITISAVPTDSKASVSGTGTKTLRYGKNSFTVTVTAENGTKKSYYVIVTKPDTRNSNNNLKSLTVDQGKIDFNKNTTGYLIKVEHDVSSVTISASAEDSKATVTGTGKKTLQDYVNEFKIVVKAENETTKTYTVKVARKDKDGNYGKLSSDNSVKSITIPDFDFKFSNSKKTYNVLVEKDVKDLNIKVVPNDSKASVNITGNKDLKAGLNVVKVEVSSESGSKNEFTFNVYKIGEEEKQQSTKQEETKAEKSSFNIWLVIAIVELLVIAGLGVLLVLKKKPAPIPVTPVIDNNQPAVEDNKVEDTKPNDEV